MANDQLLAELADDGSGAGYSDYPVDEAKAEEPVSSKDEPVADETHTQATDEGEQDAPATVSIEDFKALQTKYEKRYAEDQKKLTQLQARATAPPKGPTPEEVQTFNAVKAEFDQMSNLAQTGATDEDVAYGNFHAGRLRSKVIEAQSVLIAREIGLDPDSPDYQRLLASNYVSDESELRSLAWQAKAVSNPAYTQSETLQDKADELQKAEETIPETIRRILREEGAINRQTSGANATVGVQPAGSPGSEAEVRKLYEKAKTAQNWDAVFELKDKHPFLR